MAPGVLDHDGGDVVVVCGVRGVRNRRSATMGRPGAASSARKGKGTPGPTHRRADYH